MAKYYGSVGFAETTETRPGIYTETIVERDYSGDLLQNIRNLQTSDSVNDDINVANKISIVSDPYADQNFHTMRYIRFMGAKWKISRVEVQRPRLILTIGGLYNGRETYSTD